MRRSLFSELKGLQLKSVHRYGDDVLVFVADNGREFRMDHSQDCCESVHIEDICGDLDDLIGSPILEAEESSNSDNPPRPTQESHTWTFYKLGTIKGSVTIRWLGESNGYYSESVDFHEVTPS